MNFFLNIFFIIKQWRLTFDVDLQLFGGGGTLLWVVGNHCGQELKQTPSTGQAHLGTRWQVSTHNPPESQNNGWESMPDDKGWYINVVCSVKTSAVLQASSQTGKGLVFVQLCWRGTLAQASIQYWCNITQESLLCTHRATLPTHTHPSHPCKHTHTHIHPPLPPPNTHAPHPPTHYHPPHTHTHISTPPHTNTLSPPPHTHTHTQAPHPPRHNQHTHTHTQLITSISHTHKKKKNKKSVTLIYTTTTTTTPQDYIHNLSTDLLQFCFTT